MPRPPKDKLARLVKAQNPKKWYIEYYYTDPHTAQEIRKRFYKINTIEDLQKRERYAQDKVSHINALQAMGYNFNPFEKKPQEKQPPPLQALSLFEMLEKAAEIKKPTVAKKTRASYNQAIADLKTFLQEKKWTFKNPNHLKDQHLLAYSDYILTEKKLSAKTRNNYFSYLRSLFGVLLERELIGQNPLEKIKDLKVIISHKNFAFQTHHIPLVKQAYANQHPDLWLYAQFIYYCFMRPGEIAKMKVGDVNLARKQIFIPAQNTKVKRSDYVTIPDVFLPAVKARIDQVPEAFFVFGTPDGPGPEKIPDNKMSKLSRKALDQLNLHKNFTLYSWKHTGVVAAHNAGINIKHIQMQCRHRSLDDTNTYLKSLGLKDNLEISLKMPGI